MKNLNKKELFKKISNLSPLQIKNLGLDFDEINYIKYKLLNDKLGLVLNFEEKDELLDQNYFGLKEVPKLHINPKEKNNNLLIEGDNYYALKALKISRIKVDVIYIDPPYNTGNKDFTYNDEYVDKEDDYKHSKWLTFMKKRLTLAKELLSNDGVIFISIDDNEQPYLRVLMDEIFGEENFISDLIWIRNPGGESDNKYIAKTKDFIVMYANNKQDFKINDLLEEVNFMDFEIEGDFISKKGAMLEKGGSNDRLIDRPNLGYVVYYNPTSDKVITSHDYDKNKINESLQQDEEIYNFNKNYLENGYFPIIPRKIKNTYGCWRMGDDKFNKLLSEKKIIFEKKKNKYKIYEKIVHEIINPYKYIRPKDLITFTSNVNGTHQIKNIFSDKIFTNPKPSKLIKYLINLCSNKNATILDFFAGSGTTAHATMELNEEDGGNRRFILCTNNENNIARDICRERIYRVINGKGSNNEDISWKYSNEKKSFINNSMKYLKVKVINKFEGDYEDINKLKDLYLNEFNKEITIKDFQK